MCVALRVIKYTYFIKRHLHSHSNSTNCESWNSHSTNANFEQLRRITRYDWCVTRGSQSFTCTHTRTIPAFTPQLQSITAVRPVPTYTASWQRHIGVRNLPRVCTLRAQPRLKPTTSWSQVRHSTDSTRCHLCHHRSLRRSLLISLKDTVHYTRQWKLEDVMLERQLCWCGHVKLLWQRSLRPLE